MGIFIALHGNELELDFDILKGAFLQNIKV